MREEKIFAFVSCANCENTATNDCNHVRMATGASCAPAVVKSTSSVLPLLVEVGDGGKEEVTTTKLTSSSKVVMSRYGEEASVHSSV